MLQRLLLITITLCSLTASAQWQQTGSKVRYVTGIGIPTKDTAAGVLADSSQILIRPADSSLYMKYKRTWMRVGGGGGSIAGSGTTNYIPKFTSSSAIGNSQIFDNGTNVGIGTSSPAAKLSVQGTTLINTNTDNGTDKLQVNGSASIANATFNGTVAISNSTGIPANAGGSNLFFVGGFASPVSGRVLIGDGTGWKMHFSKRLSSVTTDLVTIQDNGDITASGTVLSTQFKLSALNTAPASSTDTGTTGEIRISGTYIYICTATNTWRRVAIGTW